MLNAQKVGLGQKKGLLAYVEGWFRGDVLVDEASIRELLPGCDCAFYIVLIFGSHCLDTLPTFNYMSKRPNGIELSGRGSFPQKVI